VGGTGLLRARFAENGAEIVLDRAWETEVESLSNRFLSEFVPRLERFCAQEFGDGVSLGHIADEPLMRTVGFGASGRPTSLGPLSAYLEETGQAYLRVAPGSSAVEVLPKAMSKGQALHKLQTELGISPGRTAVAGDEYNDLPMFSAELAAFQTCPGNACDAVKEAVWRNGGTVAMAPYSDGVIERLRRPLPGV